MRQTLKSAGFLIPKLRKVKSVKSNLIKLKSVKTAMLSLSMIAALTFQSTSHAELIINGETVDDTATMETTVGEELSISSDTQQLERQSMPLQNLEVLAYRQAPTEDSIIKLMQVLRVDDQIDHIVNSQMSIQSILENRSILTDAEADEEVSERQQQIAESMEELLGEYSQILNTGLNEKFSKESLTESYIKAAQNHYSQQQVDALIAFYDTPMGQSILDKNQLVNTEFLKSTMPDEEEMQQTQEQLEQLGPLIKEIMKDVF